MAHTRPAGRASQTRAFAQDLHARRPGTGNCLPRGEHGERHSGVDDLLIPCLLEPGSPSWPTRLARIEGAPERLWTRGRAELLAAPHAVAIVGSRSPSPYGEAQARRFARALASAGVLIVSGLARGIDHAAHEAALDAAGTTVAVLGSGVDVPWPDGPLARRMARDGALISEYEPGRHPRPHHFPLRNRLISGLSDGVLVIEAAQASGSLITARWAADQARCVWALPGRVDQPQARGSHRLLRDGATLVEDPEEILAELAGHPAALAERKPRFEDLSGIERTLASLLQGETLSTAELVERARVDTLQVLATMVELELRGVVVRAPGGLWRLVP